MSKLLQADSVAFAYRPRSNVGLIFGFGLAFTFTAFVAGVMAAILPYQFILVLLLVPIMLVLPWRYPWLGVIGLLALVGGLLPAGFAPQLPLLGGRIHVEDMFFAYMFLILFIVHLRGEKTWLMGFRPYFPPLLLLFLLAVVSVGYALFYMHTSPKEVLGELRHLFYWLLAPMVMVALDSQRKLYLFVRALLVVAVMLALGQIVQSVFGISILSGGRLEFAETMGASSRDAIRSTTPGIYLVLFGFFLLTARYLWLVKNALFGMPLLLLFGAGILVTYGRTLWFVSALGTVYLVFLARGRRVVQLMVFGIALTVVVTGAIGLAKPHALDAIVERLSSYQAEISSGQSLGWRFEENQYALTYIRANPLMGVGLGGAYKPGLRPEIFEGEHRYIHNGYLYLMLKLGVLSILFLAWFYWVAYRQGRQQLRSEESAWVRAVTAASLVVISLPLVSSLTRPEWMTVGSIATMATLVGIMGSIQALHTTHQLEARDRKNTASPFH